MGADEALHRQWSGDREFTLYPAIDIYEGKCVRLFQGDYEARTEYNANPVEVAKEFVAAGAKWLHVVDLNAAKTGGEENRGVIRDIAAVCREHSVHVQVGGGVRSETSIDALLASGVERCIIGTAVRNTEWMQQMADKFGGERLVAGLDGRDGKLAVKGWIEQTNLSLVALAKTLSRIGLRTALVTDVARDGTLTGPNLTLSKEVQAASGLAVLASGGVGSMADVLAAKNAKLDGAIVGRALYDGRIDIGAALKQLEVEGC